MKSLRSMLEHCVTCALDTAGLLKVKGITSKIYTFRLILVIII